MKLLLLEDDKSWAKKIEDALRKSVKNLSIVHIDSEYAFRKYMQKEPNLNFDAAIFDIMFRWASYTEVMDENAMDNVPCDVEKEIQGLVRWRAGIRCRNLMRDHLSMQKAHMPPHFFFSVLNSEDLKADLPNMNGDTPLFIKSEGVKILIDRILNRASR